MELGQKNCKRQPSARCHRDSSVSTVKGANESNLAPNSTQIFNKLEGGEIGRIILFSKTDSKCN